MTRRDVQLEHTVAATDIRFGVTGDGVTDDCAGLAAAAAEAVAAGATLVLENGRIFACPNLRLPAGLNLWSDGAILRRRSGAWSGVEAFVLQNDDVVIDGDLTIDGNAASVTGVKPTDGQAGIRMAGNRAFIGEDVKVIGFTSGFAYGIEVRGDECVVNGRCEDASWAGLRLFNTGGTKRRRFTIGRFESHGHRRKGFVVNGRSGIEVIDIGTLIARTSTPEDASDGLLIDTDADGSAVHVDRVVANVVDIYGHRSNGLKIENTTLFEARTVRIRNSHEDFPPGAAARFTARHTAIELLDTDRRIVANGTLIVGHLKGRPPQLAQPHAVEITAALASLVDCYVRIGNLDLSDYGTTAQALRIDVDGAIVHVEVGKYVPSSVAPRPLHGIFGTGPSNTVGFLRTERSEPEMHRDSE